MHTWECEAKYREYHVPVNQINTYQVSWVNGLAVLAATCCNICSPQNRAIMRSLGEEHITYLNFNCHHTISHWALGSINQARPVVPPQTKDPLEGSHSDLPPLAPLLDDRMHERLAKHFIYPTLSVYSTGLGEIAAHRLRECCRQSHAEVIRKSSNKIH